MDVSIPTVVDRTYITFVYVYIQYMHCAIHIHYAM